MTTDALRAADGSTSQRADRRLNRRPAGSHQLNTFPSLGFLERITLELRYQKENSLLHWLLTLSARAGSAAAASEPETPPPSSGTSTNQTGSFKEVKPENRRKEATEKTSHPSTLPFFLLLLLCSFETCKMSAHFLVAQICARGQSRRPKRASGTRAT